MQNDVEFCADCDGCGWYEGGATVQTSCEACQGTGIVKRVQVALIAATSPSTSHASDWLSKIEALRPGDACEFHYPARKEWRRGTVRINGGAHWWTVVDETEQKLVSGLYIEMIRLPGQVEAWPLQSP